MNAGFIVIALVPALVAGALFFLWRVGPGLEQESRGAEGVRPVSMWPYVLACYVCYGSILLLGGAVKFLLGGAPPVFGLAAPFVAIPVAVWLFTRSNRRGLLSGERWWLTLGCIVVVWIYQQTQSVVLLISHGPATSEQILITVVASLVDLVVVCVIVAVAAAVARRFISSKPGAPPNNRWRGP
jgi:hypothetical protein